MKYTLCLLTLLLGGCISHYSNYQYDNGDDYVSEGTVRIVNDDNVYLGTMDIEARRNAYGRQLGSFACEAEFEGIGRIPMTFIRAPYIERVGKKAKVLSVVDGHIVAARQGNQLVTAFHPELTDDSRVHEYFLDMVKKRK